MSTPGESEVAPERRGPQDHTDDETHKRQKKLTKPVRTKRSTACNYCRLKKVRCNGGNPCTYCADHNITCVWVKNKKFRDQRKLEHPVENISMTDGLALLGALLKSAQGGYPSLLEPLISHVRDLQPAPTQSEPLQQIPSAAIPIVENALQSEQLRDPTATALDPIFTSGTPSTSPTFGELPKPQMWHVSRQYSSTDNPFTAVAANPGATQRTPSQDLSSHSEFYRTPRECPPSSDEIGKSPDEAREGSSIHSGRTSNYEYHGPRSFLSICSKRGISWVVERTGSPNFNEIAVKFTRENTQLMKVQRRFSRDRTPEPPPETAWKYTTAYFEEALDATFGIVHRPWFESHLRAYLNGEDDDQDPAWYAIRNVIYASGCRIVLGKYKTVREANQISWRWFENALSVLTEILCFRTSLMSVQALTLMAYFTENISTPCLEYMLCSVAVRLATSMGLHRQAVPAWGLSENDCCQRNWLFWAAYCLEKQIVIRGGRPSVIDDDDINCQVPLTALLEGSGNVVYCHILIRLAKISSLAAKKLSSVRGFCQSSESLANVVGELDEQLNAMKAEYSSILRLDAPVDPSRLPPTLNLQQALYLQYAYFNTVFEIHTVLTYPWSQSLLGLAQHPTLRSQAEHSVQVVAKTCRDAIIAMKQIHVVASTPLPLSYHGPLCALINMFIFILQNPAHPHVKSDLGLMDVGAGHFALLEFITDFEISVPFVKDLSILAGDAVKYAAATSAAANTTYPFKASNTETPENSSSTNLPIYDNRERLMNDDDASTQLPMDFEEGPDALKDISMAVDIPTFELENWSTLLPWPEFDDSMPNGILP